jgi:hypothetical protein
MTTFARIDVVSPASAPHAPRAPFAAPGAPAAPSRDDKAASAPYFSPVFRFDPVDQELIVEFRDSATGAVEQSYPSLWIEKAYRLTGRVEAKGPVAFATERQAGAPASRDEAGQAPAPAPIFLET